MDERKPLSMNRRQWLYGAGLVAGASPFASAIPEGQAERPPAPKPLDLSQYEPKSMLRVHETQVERAKFPLIDIHTHITVSTKSEAGVELSGDRQYLGTPQELFSVPINNAPAGVNYNVSADGSRFLIMTLPENPSDLPLTLVQNWISSLNR